MRIESTNTLHVSNEELGTIRESLQTLWEGDVTGDDLESSWREKIRLLLNDFDDHDDQRFEDRPI